MPQVVKAPVRPEGLIRPHEHRPRRVVGQPAERAPPRPPHRIIAARRDQPVQLLLIQTQPHERVRRGRKRLQRPRSLAHDGDRLIARADAGAPGRQQLRRPGPRGDPERHQCPVPVAAQCREQLGERRVRNLAWNLLSHPWPVPPRLLVGERVHRIAMGCGPAGPAGQRERAHDPGTRLQAGAVERTEHALAVRYRRRRISRSRCLLPGHRIRACAGAAPPVRSGAWPVRQCGRAGLTAAIIQRMKSRASHEVA